MLQTIIQMHENTEFTLSRDCEAIQIPSGQKVTIPAGTPGVITQALGGTYTVATYQGLSRIAEKDLDALGLEKPKTTQNGEKASEGGHGDISEDSVWSQFYMNMELLRSFTWPTPAEMAEHFALAWSGTSS